MEHTQFFEAVDLSTLDQLADRLATEFPRQMSIGLVGTLGVGKTTFVQRIAARFGIDPAEVTSPTFTLLQSHSVTNSGPPVLHHLDAYRLADEDEFWELGVDELFDQPGWTFVEWADRVSQAMPVNTLWIHIEHGPEETRQIVFRSEDEVIGGLLKTMRTK